MLEEAERSMHDALCVVNDTVQRKRVVFGGGAAELEMAQAVDELAATVCSSNVPRFSHCVDCC
jgi:T-complex protein 1 subunit beta